jgi:hypothetical protein
MCEEHSPHSPLQMLRRAERRPKRRWTIDLIRRVVEETAGRGLREIIPSTMGEPLLYEHFEEIVDALPRVQRQVEPDHQRDLPGLGARAWAERIVPVTSDVKLSWNGATAETQEQIMLGSKWEKVLDNAGRSSACGMTTQRAAATAAGSRSSSRSSRPTCTSWPTWFDSPRAGRRPSEGAPPLGALRTRSKSSRCGGAQKRSSGGTSAVRDAASGDTHLRCRTASGCSSRTSSSLMRARPTT